MVFDFFKKKPFDKTQGKEDKKIEPKKQEQVQPVKKVSFGGMSGAVLRNLHMSEKASIKAEENQYIFKVAQKATKYAIKNAVQEAFGVIAEKVNMVTIPSKIKRRGKGIGVKQGYKKAIVTVKKGQKIEVLAR